MTFEEAYAYLDSEEVLNQYLKDDRGLLLGLQLINKYKPLGYFQAAEHDILYIAPLHPEMTKEEILQMHRWGFHLDEDGECWALHC